MQMTIPASHAHPLGLKMPVSFKGSAWRGILMCSTLGGMVQKFLSALSLDHLPQNGFLPAYEEPFSSRA